MGRCVISFWAGTSPNVMLVDWYAWTSGAGNNQSIQHWNWSSYKNNPIPRRSNRRFQYCTHGLLRWIVFSIFSSSCVCSCVTPGEGFYCASYWGPCTRFQMWGWRGTLRNYPQVGLQTQVTSRVASMDRKTHTRIHARTHTCMHTHTHAHTNQ